MAFYSCQINERPQIPGNANEYESAMSAHAQTREHAVLLKALVRYCLS